MAHPARRSCAVVALTCGQIVLYFLWAILIGTRLLPRWVHTYSLAYEGSLNMKRSRGATNYGSAAMRKGILVLVTLIGALSASAQDSLPSVMSRRMERLAAFPSRFVDAQYRCVAAGRLHFHQGVPGTLHARWPGALQRTLECQSPILARRRDGGAIARAYPGSRDSPHLHGSARWVSMPTTTCINNSST